MIKASHHLQILAAGEDGVDGGGLAGEADDSAQAGLVAADVVPGDAGFAVVHVDEGGKDANEGGLAGAVGAEESEYGARLDVDAGEGQDVAVGLRHAAHGHGGLGHDGVGGIVSGIDQGQASLDVPAGRGYSFGARLGRG